MYLSVVGKPFKIYYIISQQKLQNSSFFYIMFSIFTEPITTILGEDLGEIFINQGSTINLTCIVRNLPETSSTVMHWTHNNEVIFAKKFML